MLKILHTSDLHGRISEIIKKHEFDDFDIWIDSGDFLPDHPEFAIRKIATEDSRTYQRQWLFKKIPHIQKWLNGRTMLSIRGNHDWIDLTKHFGKNVISAEKGIEINGTKFIGFNEIPNCGNFFWNEVHPYYGFDEVIQKVREYEPDILITHAPPNGILDIIKGPIPHNLGIVMLRRFLLEEKHNIKYHMFGHIHFCGGNKVRHNGINFYNGACRATNIAIGLDK